MAENEPFVLDASGSPIRDGDRVAVNVSGHVFLGRVVKRVQGRKPRRAVVHVELETDRPDLGFRKGRVSKLGAYVPYGRSVLECNHLIRVDR